jgi:hypothetical protein
MDGPMPRQNKTITPAQLKKACTSISDRAAREIAAHYQVTVAEAKRAMAVAEKNEMARVNDDQPFWDDIAKALRK